MENYVMVDDRYVKDLEESLELCEKSYAEVNTNLILLEAENRGLKVKAAQLEAQVQLELDRNLNNVSNYQLQVEELKESHSNLIALLNMKVICVHCGRECKEEVQ